VVRRVDDFALIKKGYDTSRNADLIREWRLADAPPKKDKPKEKESEPAEPEPDPQRPPEEEPELRAPG
jgi:hypothetical protein